MPGKVSKIMKKAGDKISKGECIMTLEAMKMQTTLYAPCDGSVEEIAVAAGDAVDAGDLLVRLRE